MRRTKNTPKVPADALAAARAAAAELDNQRALRAAQEQAAELQALKATLRGKKAHPSGRGCSRCGDTHPAGGWSTATGVAGLPSPCCTACSDPQCGPGNDGWARPILAEAEVKGVLLSRLLGLGTDVRWLYSWGSGRFGLEFQYAAEVDLPEGDRAPWSHVDLGPWRPVAVEAARRQRAFGAPKVFGAVIDGLSVDEVLTEWAGYRAAVNQAGPIDRVHLARRRPDLPEWTQEQIEAAEERALAERLAALDAEELATAAKLAEQSARKARADARGLLDRRIRRQVAEHEKRLRREAALA